MQTQTPCVMACLLLRAAILACVSILSLLGGRKHKKDLSTGDIANHQAWKKELPLVSPSSVIPTIDSNKVNNTLMREKDAALMVYRDSNTLQTIPTQPPKGTYMISRTNRNNCPWGWEKVSTELGCIQAAMKLLLSGLTDGYIGVVPFYTGVVSMPDYPAGCHYGRDHRTHADGAVSFNQHWLGKDHQDYSVICRAGAYKLRERNTNDCRLDFRWHNVSTINDCHRAAVWLGLSDKFPAHVHSSELPGGCSHGETGLSFNSNPGSSQERYAAICQARHPRRRDAIHAIHAIHDPSTQEDERYAIHAIHADAVDAGSETSKKTEESAQHLASGRERKQTEVLASFAHPNPGRRYKARTQNPPCDTMFIGSLAAGVRPGELLEFLSKIPGYVRLRMSGSRQTPVAFVLFDSVHSCSEALPRLHGTTLPSSPQQALVCEFARNSLDKRASN